MIVLGLTGSIGMGKSTTAGLFREEGLPVYDADAEVAALYARGGEAVAKVGEVFPEAVVDGMVDRGRLSAALLARPQDLDRLETIVHPLLAARRAAFLEHARAAGAPIAVLDVPLLYETGADAQADAVVVVSAPEAMQRERALARPGMSPDKLELILSRQVPDADKRARADFVIDTGAGVPAARQQVRQVLEALRTPSWTPRRRRP